MSAEPYFPELLYLFENLSPDPLKKKAPARTVNADAGQRNQNCKDGVAPEGPQLKLKAVKQKKRGPESEIQASWSELDFDGKKSLLSGGNGEKASSVGDAKASSVEDAKAPSDYLPMRLLGVVDGAGLTRRLCRSKQHEWDSPKRIAGLLMIIDFIARKGPGTSKKPGVAMSSELSREYVSPKRRAKNASTISQPLPLLVEIGILEVVQKAVVAPHRKTSARYRIHPSHGEPKKIEVMLTAQQREKLQSAEKRNEKRLNGKYPFRNQLRVDLATVGLSADGRNLALTMMTRGEKDSSIKRLIAIIDGSKPREISIDPCGTIHCFARQAPRELKPHMTLGGKPVAICDLESAHICALSCVLQERINWLAERGLRTGDLDQERRIFIALLESADIYRYLADGGDRKRLKKSLLTALNTPTSKAVHIHAYQRFRQTFPLTVCIIEDIKKNGHHGISRPLQHHTARIVRNVLEEAQKSGIPCIPDTDAMIVPAAHKAAVMAMMRRALLEVTGIDRRS